MKHRKPTPVEANLSPQQMQASIPKIDRRIADLRSLEIQTVKDRGDPRIGVLSNQLDALLVSVFGVGTVEYDRYKYAVTRLDRAPHIMGEELPLSEVREGLQEGIDASIASLVSIRAGFLEELGDLGDTSPGRALKAYAGLELHPAIERAAGNLYRDGHYANAVEDAVKALNAIVRLNSGVDDKDGTNLMEHVFSPKNPILRLNSLTDSSDNDEQRGFMMMFSGVVAGLRNPRAHKIIKDDPEMALEFIACVSLLAKIADKAAR